ncbi:elongation factor 1-beta-like [Macrobrachium nipponense]|uniref:elongation factor 1-beta-like n=1 Tax=Macrobrachium nipponense TaxID=159736 RepID=UPI0030C88BB1
MAGSKELPVLDAHLSKFSYVGGYKPSKLDTTVLASGHVPSSPPSSLPHLRRWAKHMASFSSSECSAFPSLSAEYKVDEHLSDILQNNLKMDKEIEKDNATQKLMYNHEKSNYMSDMSVHLVDNHSIIAVQNRQS